ncbi:MAG: SsrA-binding protein SmpB [Chloroflexi bacterium]|nr:SsrA-binding protein SmpB [Chloroflexota bacterium]
MSERVLVTNRKAYHDYHVLETVEAGIALTGTEVKSIRAGRVNLREGYARIERGEAWLHNVHIAPYDQGNRYNHEPMRPRKLLLHRGELNRLAAKSREAGCTLVPLKLYDKRSRLKIELGLVRGKREYDKRAALSAREARRDIEREVKDYFR